MTPTPTLAAAEDAVLIALIAVYLLFIVALHVAWFAGLWKVHQKAGEPGWTAIVPVYNFMVSARIGGRPDWWGLLCLIPFVGYVFLILITIDLARAFRKEAGFMIGLILVPFVFYPILGFGKSRYHGPAAVAPGRPPSAR